MAPTFAIFHMCSKRQNVHDFLALRMHDEKTNMRKYFASPHELLSYLEDKQDKVSTKEMRIIYYRAVACINKFEKKRRSKQIFTRFNKIYNFIYDPENHVDSDVEMVNSSGDERKNSDDDFDDDDETARESSDTSDEDDEDFMDLESNHDTTSTNESSTSSYSATAPSITRQGLAQRRAQAAAAAALASKNHAKADRDHRRTQNCTIVRDIWGAPGAAFLALNHSYDCCVYAASLARRVNAFATAMTFVNRALYEKRRDANPARACSLRPTKAELRRGCEMVKAGMAASPLTPAELDAFVPAFRLRIGSNGLLEYQ